MVSAYRVSWSVLSLLDTYKHAFKLYFGGICVYQHEAILEYVLAFACLRAGLRGCVCMCVGGLAVGVC